MKNTLLSLAWQSILKNKMRTLLTMLGIVIGVGAVIIMVAVGQGARSKIQEQINSLGTNLIVITPGSIDQGGVNQGAGAFNRLTVEDAEQLKRDATTVSGVTPIVLSHAQIIGPQGNWHTMVNGVSTDFFAIRNWQTMYGSPFGDDDVRAGRKVVLADEPTGNLDSRTSIELMALFQQLNDQGITIVLVTHEPDIAQYAKRIVEVRDGHIIRDHPVANRRSAAADLASASQTGVELPVEALEEAA